MPTPKNVAAITLCVISALLVSCGSEEFLEFADTPENRALFEKDLKAYEDNEAKHGRYAEVNGIKLHYLEFGNDTGTPLILEPGSSSTAHFLNPFVKQITDAGFHLFIYDPRGRGQTQVADPNFSIYHVADDVKALMDHEGIQCAIVGGHSKGGFTAAAVYDEYPERVMGLVLMDGGSWSDQRMRELHYFGEKDGMQEGFFKRMFKLKPPQNPASRIGEETFADRFEAFQAYMESAMFLKAEGDVPMDRMTNGEVAANFRQNEDGRWKWHVDSTKIMGTLEPGIFSHPATKQRLLQWSQQAMIPEVVFRNLDVPVLIMDPQSDPDTYPVTDYNEYLTAQHPDLIQYEVYPDTPHAMYLYRPEKFLDDLLTFGKKIQENPIERCRSVPAIQSED